jgi:light-independent protochlorophyllide reductase subunit B
MGLEEHLLAMFREDFEFNDEAKPSHLGAAAVPAAIVEPSPAMTLSDSVRSDSVSWSPEAENELQKVPFFVRGKARRNTERYAQDRGVPLITIETIYDAKAHFGR